MQLNVPIGLASNDTGCACPGSISILWNLLSLTENFVSGDYTGGLAMILKVRIHLSTLDEHTTLRRDTRLYTDDTAVLASN